MSSATSGLAADLSAAILNQDDPETVRDGAPAYLLMLDSFVQGSPNDPAMLAAAALVLAVALAGPRTGSATSRIQREGIAIAMVVGERQTVG